MFHEKNLQRAADISAWIAYHQANIEIARRMPLTVTSWQGPDEHLCLAHYELQMTDAKLHEILVASVIADAEKQIADLREELGLLGVALEGQHTRLQVIANDEPRQQVPVTVLPSVSRHAPSREVVKRMKKVVSGGRRK